MKLSAQMDSIPPEVEALMLRYQNSLLVDLQQRAHEFVELAKNPKTMRSVLPVAESSIDIEVDEKLSFLDGYVQTALANGAQPFQEGREIKTGEMDQSDNFAQKNKPKGLVFTPYASQTVPGTEHVVEDVPFPTSDLNNSSDRRRSDLGEGSSLGFRPTSNVFGRPTANSIPEQ